MSERVVVIGAGLAGSEAAWQIAQRGIPVDLFEMRPSRLTEAHTTSRFAELVCSNSFGSETPGAASQILKTELEQLGGLILATARQHRVPAGASLAVDREKFSAEVTERLAQCPLVTIRREEVSTIPPDAFVVIATGPLTSPALSESLCQLIGGRSLYFYDAISPIVASESLNLEKMFFANRYGKGETSDFLNIPLDREQYFTFVDELLKGEVVLPHDFEQEKYFEGCMPIEALAARGPQTLAFGPMKPVGLSRPDGQGAGKRPFAVIQLRTENAYKTAYNLVGFQTKLKYKEQERIFRTLPGLEEAEFLRLGSMHRNTYIDSPRCLRPTLQLRKHPKVFIAGQLTGTEGYLESSATGCLAGINVARLVQGQAPLTLPVDTMLGALLAAITDESRENFQPMNSNMGIMPPLPPAISAKGKVMKRDRQERNAAYASLSSQSLTAWRSGVSEGFLRPRADSGECSAP